MDDRQQPEKNLTDDFKAQMQEATQALMAQAAFWKVWMPGGLRKRKRYRTKGQGMRRAERRRKNKVAKTARRANRRPKKKRR
jgi:hypothetical protein